ncbi:MAG TPA: metal ABC transporter ATP-binding protein [Candidatus Paceibacterota bacterium]|nr:metal ABC transporter ATP-binding protein [Candidatus Paceibacterota bacterium]
MLKNILQVKNLSVTLGNQKIIEGVSFNVKPEEVVAIIGPNGAGKSVLLKTLLGIIPKTSGEVIWAPGVKIGYLPQRFQVDKYLPMTIKEFLNLQPKQEYKIEEVIKMVGFPIEAADKVLSHLSGGEMQKALLAWTLIGKPDILLFDEPTENVDVVNQKSIYTLLHHLQDTLNIAIILISHDLHVVYRYANVVICLNKEMICRGLPQEALTTEKLGELYGDHAFFHHSHLGHTHD